MLHPCQPWTATREIASRAGLSSSPVFCGHGIGRHFHQPPLIHHYSNREPGVMREGLTFTIEPILCQGLAGHRVWADGWTAATLDGGRAAQFEHTLLITPDGHEVLT
jgi:methionyl aminopeptidase